jgi:hypothetical protein
VTHFFSAHPDRQNVGNRLIRKGSMKLSQIPVAQNARFFLRNLLKKRVFCAAGIERR